MPRKFLDNVYDHIGTGIQSFYDDWADTYEAEVNENGYVTPSRCARALATHLEKKTGAILDFGCGTGLSGVALNAAGFHVIDGFDLSAEMLTHARAKKVYRSTQQVTADNPLPFSTGSYAAIAAIGVIGPGAAPLEVFDDIIDQLAPGNLFVFSFNDHALEDPQYAAKVASSVDSGVLKLLVQDHGPHLPARNINSTVYLTEKL